MTAEHELLVVGLGYVGIPLALRACRAGLRTAGLDVDPSVVDTLAAARSHVAGVSDEDIAELRLLGFAAGTAPSVIASAETVVICVPTGLTADRTPDLGPLRAASRTVGAHLRTGTLVVVESTSHPGTTEEVVLPILERESGLRAGEDFYLAFAPERIDPGNERFGLGNTPKVVGGHTPLCAKYCAAFYGRFVDTVVVARGTREAELAKLLENTYRRDLEPAKLPERLLLLPELPLGPTGKVCRATLTTLATAAHPPSGRSSRVMDRGADIPVGERASRSRSATASTGRTSG
ncbi:nucleotide sugar dehydrogenase [Actinophytocola algeriensis]|uniref:Nucleotide sugar dehydrogenase n=1 Tax=Actinophytocola algeriensis TaxID=1768010 RepID=A0A7W7VJE8_9PSEU|nr:nucleotide sugar dehydrogenase [Actinophytocola algeriensis]MBB4912269.1 nucleotide sugar dehydrogenase [Actinophytocola algeriensis]MBE1474215.1 nucleotide sugar dehydrogenase [Actinophytocola algeriensis]